MKVRLGTCPKTGLGAPAGLKEKRRAADQHGALVSRGVDRGWQLHRLAPLAELVAAAGKKVQELSPAMPSVSLPELAGRPLAKTTSSFLRGKGGTGQDHPDAHHGPRSLCPWMSVGLKGDPSFHTSGHRTCEGPPDIPEFHPGSERPSDRKEDQRVKS